MTNSCKCLCRVGLSRHSIPETVTALLDFIETFIRPIRSFWLLRLHNVPYLRYHDDHVASNDAALSNPRRNNRHSLFAFPRTKCVLRRYEMFKPYLVYRLELPSFPSHSQWSPAFRTQETATVLSGGGGGGQSECVNVEAEEDKLL